MKLVYLWIKNYKNIDELGVLLSTDFNEKNKTEYNSEKKRLTIKLSTANNYNLFEDNFNIKTVIGANGSGKSNLCNALISILRKNYKKEVDDYFDNTLPYNYYLLFYENGKYKYLSGCKNIELYIDNNKIDAEEESGIKKCAVFRPFLNKEDEDILTFPQDIHMTDIISKKIDNYFYYDRFRLYDTSHSLRNLFDKNLTKYNKEIKILSDKNNYLMFDFYGYEINIKNQFEWLTRQVNINFPQMFSKEEVSFNSIWDLVDIIRDSDNYIIEKAKRGGFKDIDEFAHKVVSNGCFIFILLKIAELFSYRIYYKSLINLKNLNKILINLDGADKEKHIQFKNFYIQIKKELFVNNTNNEIKQLLLTDNILSSFSKLLDTCIYMEEELSKNNNIFKDIIVTDDGNVYRAIENYMIYVVDQKLNKEMERLNNLGIFKCNFYNFRGQKTPFTFFDLSTGEQRMLRLFADILSTAPWDLDIFIFDEMDLSWHPEWQRKMVYYIIDIFNKINPNKYINIIFTTHSPFILSDMSSENVILLNRDKTGKTRIYEKNIDTFCANIYDLFKNEFFLNSCDGICTIGEFAKSKIKLIQNDIRILQDMWWVPLSDKFLNPPKNLIDEINNKFKNTEDLINKISEPILRKSLLRELYNIPNPRTEKDIINIIVENFELKRKLKNSGDDK